MAQYDNSDIQLAAILVSKICHDIISPVGAINNGLEVLADDPDPASHEYALSVIRTSTEQASAKLQFARIAYGAAGSTGSQVDLREAHGLAQGILDPAKHSLDWQIGPGVEEKDTVKLLLVMFALGLAALPRGGAISVSMADAETPGRPIVVVAAGQNARLQDPVMQMLTATSEAPEPGTVQAFYGLALASSLGRTLSVEPGQDQIVLTA